MSLSYEKLLPPLLDEELAALEASIKADGVRVPVEVDENGVILDGHHRLKFDPNAPRIIIKNLSPGEKLAYVMSSNLLRRNMTPDQKSALRQKQIEVAMILKEEGKIQAEVATKLGVARNTVSGWLQNISNVGSDNADNSHLDVRIKITDQDKTAILARLDAGATQKLVAKEYGVSQSRISGMFTSRKPAVSHKKGGGRIIIQDGRTPESVCREGLKMEEAEGLIPKEVAKKIGLSSHSYRKIRDMILLTDHNHLIERDRIQVSLALSDLNKNGRLAENYEKLKPIINHVWGGNKSGDKSRSLIEKRRQEEFDRALGVILRVCKSSHDISVPYLTAGQCTRAVNDLELAVRAIRDFITKIRKIHT